MLVRYGPFPSLTPGTQYLKAVYPIKLPYVDSFLCETGLCENFCATVFCATSKYTDKHVCATVVFATVFPTTSTFVRQSCLCDSFFDDKHVCATVYCATVFPTTSSFVRQFFVRKRVCATNFFRNNFIATTFLCDSNFYDMIFYDKHVCAT